MIIAIDGHSSCGKSSFAKEIARELNILYIDSGAMYRAATLYCIRKNFFNEKQLIVRQLIDSLDELKIEFQRESGQSFHEIYLNGENVEKEIRTMEISSKVSEVSIVAELRKKMVGIQRSYGEKQNVVMDGRDIGSVVFPDADIKIFLTASLKVRAERRFKELNAKGNKVNFAEVQKNLGHRDEIDQNRKHSPLIRANNSILLDNSEMTPEEQMQWFREFVKNSRSENRN